MSRKTRRQLLGQHFLHEKRFLQKIIEAVDPKPDDLIVEIGPGRGVLTYPLAARAGKVLAIEKDYSLVSALEPNKPANLEIIAGDILEIDLRHLIQESARRAGSIKLAGNLPYHISTQILFVLLQVREMVNRAVFLFQKEVAERIVARPGNKKYAPLSILLQNYFDCRILFTIKPGAFKPPPRVDSACLLFLKRSQPQFFPDRQEQDFYEFLKTCFAQRRKTLARNLESSGVRRDNILKILNGLGLEATVRAENLEPEKLYQIYESLAGFQNKIKPRR